MKMNTSKGAAILSLLLPVLSMTVGRKAAMTMTESLAAASVEQAKVTAAESAMLRGGFRVATVATTAGLRAATAAFADMESDLEVGADLGLDLGLEVNRTTGGPVSSSGGGDSGPATLAEYCAGKGTKKESAKVGVGTKVKADWGGYGTMYPGKVTDKNKDGTVDIKYDDGFTEKRVDMDDLKKRKKQSKLLALEARQGAPADDPACKLQEFLKKLQDQLKKLNEMTSQWLAAQRAKIAGDNKPPPQPKTISPAPPPSAAKKAAPANAEGTKDELGKLKEQLAERDEYIKELEKQAEENNKELQKLSPTTKPTTPPAMAPIDALIAEFKAKIADRDARIEELLQLIEEQEKELASLGAAQLSLKDIDDAVKALEADIEEAKRKCEELKKDGSLDPELRAVIDEIIKACEKMRSKVNNLLALEAKAKADREKAEKEAKAAAEAARKKAEEEGKDADAAAAEAEDKAKKETADKVKKADVEAMKAAQEVEKEMREAEKGATKLDTGLHPHGAKWWRYRYEHSHIEALLMIFISFLMLLWSKIVDHLRNQVRVWALPGDVSATDDDNELTDDTHGTIFVVWLHHLADQMMVCILVFLTVWLIAKTSLINFFPMLIKPSEDMRVPHTAEEYRTLALDICTIYFFAIMFYFTLMFFVAQCTSKMTSELEHFEGLTPRIDETEVLSPRTRSRRLEERIRAATMGAVTIEEYGLLKEHFVEQMNHEVATSDNEIYKDVSRLLNDDMNNFPLCKYMHVNVRRTVPTLFTFGWVMWLPTICMFGVLMMLHRFAHMGYVRIMLFFGLVTLGMIVGMGWYIKSILKLIQRRTKPEEGTTKTSWTHNDFHKGVFFLGSMQFALFFICYGVARMICQPWMWELHFWPVLSLTILAIISASLFVWLVAPAIPNFCALDSIPPYADHDNLKIMKQIAGAAELSSNQQAANKRASLRRHLSKAMI